MRSTVQYSTRVGHAAPANAASTPAVDDTAAEWRLQTKDAADRGIVERRRLAYKYMYYINEGANVIPDAQRWCVVMLILYTVRILCVLSWCS
jgi:hypothetical protein